MHVLTLGITATDHAQRFQLHERALPSTVFSPRLRQELLQGEQHASGTPSISRRRHPTWASHPIRIMEIQSNSFLLPGDETSSVKIPKRATRPRRAGVAAVGSFHFDIAKHAGPQRRVNNSENRIGRPGEASLCNY